MKLIDADKLLEALGVFKDKKHGDQHFLNGIETAMEIVEQMPEEVVLCKDCKYMDENHLTCSVWESGIYYDGYCSYGERKSDE